MMAGDFNPFEALTQSEKAGLIVDVARAMIGEEGAAAVTRQAIAKRAGLRPAEVSREFRNRAALLRAVTALTDCG